MRYNLSSNQAHRINFDEAVTRYAQDCTNEMDEDYLLKTPAVEIAEAYWLDGETYDTDDPKEAKSRYLVAFTSFVKEAQIEKVVDNYSDEQKERGEQTIVTVAEGSELDNGIWIEVVHLEDDNEGNHTVVYRRCDDSIDQDWQVGTIENVADLVIENHEEIYKQDERDNLVAQL